MPNDSIKIFRIVRRRFQGQAAMDPTDNKSWVSGRTEEEALKKAAKIFNIKDTSKITLKQVYNWFNLHKN